MSLLFLLCGAACCLVPATGEVVPNFTTCLEFFLDKTPPEASLTPPNAASICQYYKNAYRFATLYDREKRIPVYSAYKCKQGKGPRYDGWMIEPQLVDLASGKSMKDEWDTNLAAAEIEKNQAVLEDYKHALNVGKGHLNPVCHQPDEDSRAATFTLTNVVPQFSQLNQGAWASYESQVKKEAHACKDLYVITGAVPGEEYLSEGQVNKPSHIWSAACCVREKDRRTAWAAIAKNDEDQVKEQSLEKLKKALAELYGTGKVDLFNNACK